MTRIVVVLPLVPLRRGQIFSVPEWPLHVTVVPPFTTDAQPVAVATAISEALGTFGPVHAVAGHDALFGRRHDIPVTLVQVDEGLIRIHDALTDALRPLAASPDERAFTHHAFRPHVTIKGESRIREGEPLELEQVAVVDMAPRSSPGGRAVLAVVPLESG